MAAEPYGPFAIDPAWRRRGSSLAPGVKDGEAVDAKPTPESKAVPQPEPAPESEPEVVVPVKVKPPRSDPVALEAPVFKPDPSPKPAAAAKKPAVAASVQSAPSTPQVAPRRRRRLRMDRAVPYLAALIGLIALGGAIWLDQLAQERVARMSGQLGEVRVALDGLRAAVAEGSDASDSAVEALLALQNRVVTLEAQASAALAASQLAPPEALSGAAVPLPVEGLPAAAGKTKLAAGPTENCIPLGTRFVVLPGDSYPICRTPEIVKVQDVAANGVLLVGGTSIAEGASVTLKFGDCVLSVISLDADGFAELRATCS